MNDQATALIVELAKHVVDYMRTTFPAWHEVYVRIDTPSDSQRGARVSYVDANGVTLIDVMEHRALIAGIIDIAPQLRESLANNGRKFCVGLFRANARLDYHFDFEWNDPNKWAMTKLRGGTGLPVGLDALPPLGEPGIASFPKES
ncbi:hypothetical protein [Trinickia sp.]|uniref:hypothetical protein n=1 Tax=Trinickia sp. TaxID=2571163 RepID=UPI003F7FA420